MIDAHHHHTDKEKALKLFVSRRHDPASRTLCKSQIICLQLNDIISSIFVSFSSIFRVRLVLHETVY